MMMRHETVAVFETPPCCFVSQKFVKQKLFFVCFGTNLFCNQKSNTVYKNADLDLI
jgi:hypothetical protein